MISTPRAEILPTREALWRRVAFLGLSCTLLFAPHTHAGDILRGGTAAQPRNNGATAFSANPSITAQTRQNANDLLSRTNQSLQSVRAMQDGHRLVIEVRGRRSDTDLDLEFYSAGERCSLLEEVTGLEVSFRQAP